MLEPKPTGGGVRTRYVVDWNIINMPRPTTNADMFVKKTFRLLSTAMSIIGSCTRRSTRIKSTIKTNDIAIMPNVLSEVHPQRSPSVIATRNVRIVTEKVVAPMMSTLDGLRIGDSCNL